MLITALGGTAARAAEMSAAVHLALIIPLTLAVTALTLARMVACPPAPDDKMSGPRAALPTRRTLVLVAFGLSAGIAQSATQNWSVIYMEQTLAAPDWVATLPLSSYLVAMTAGRVFADGWLERWGGRTVALILSLLSLLGCIAVILAPNFWIALTGFALMGVGTAVLFPMMITGAARSTNRSAAEAVSAVDEHIFVFEGDGTTANQNLGITLKTDQTLLGHAAATTMIGGVVIQTPNPPASTGVPATDQPVIGHGSGHGVTVNNVTGVEIRDLAVDATGGHGIRVTSSGTNSVGATVRNSNASAAA